MIDPRGGDAGLLVQLAAPATPQGEGLPPSETALVAASSAIDRARADWSRSARAMSAVARARRLGSRHRRQATNLAWNVVRGRRLLEVLVGAPDGGAPSRRLVEAAAVLWGRAPLEVIGDGSARDGVADPRHALLSWVFQSTPSPARALGVAASLPDWFATELLRDREPEDAASLAVSLLERAPLTLRVVAGRADRDDVVAALAAEGVIAEPSPLSPHALVVQGYTNVPGLDAYKRGLIDVQDAGSQILAGLVRGERIIDVCAGAGGKTLAIAGALPAARLLACDVRRPALDEGLRRAKREDVHERIRFLTIQPEGRLPKAVRKFGLADTVLVDAPCTGSGSLRREPAMRWARSPLDVARLPKTQVAIIDRFAHTVAPGGRLIYATCSLFGVENEAVVRAFLKGRTDFELVPVGEVLSAEVLTAVGPSPDGMLRLRPDRHGCDGFFGAVLLRR